MQLVAFYEYLDYQRSNEKPYIERTNNAMAKRERTKGQTTHNGQKKKDKRRKKDLQNITQKTKDWANDNLIKSRNQE